MALTYVQITGQFLDSQGSPLSGTATFTPNVTVRAAGIPVLQADVPVQASITAGALKNLSGGTLQLLATDQAGLTFEGQTGFVFYTVSMVLAGQDLDPWAFFLPSSPSTVDLWSLANTPAGGGGVSSVTAADTSVVIGGTATAPTVRTSTLDVIAADHPPAAAWSNNGFKITGVANGSASTDAAAFGQIPASLPPNGSAGGDLSGTYPNPAVAKVNGVTVTGTPSAGQYPRAASGTAAAWGAIQVADVPTLNQSTTGNAATATNLAGGATFPDYVAPAVVALTDAATILVNASLGNDFSVTLGGNRTMGAPSNPVNGQKITFAIAQDVTGSRTLTWTSGAGGYSFGSGSAPTLSTAAHAVDLVAFRYSATAGGGSGAWCSLGSALGF